MRCSYFLSRQTSGTLLVVGREVGTLQEMTVPWPAVIELDLAHKITEEEARG